MKLLNKTQIYYLTLLIALLVLWSGIFLYAISRVIQSGIDETLQSEIKSNIAMMKSRQSPSLSSYSADNPLLDIKAIDSVRHSGFAYSDTSLYSIIEKEPVPYRQIITEQQIDGELVRIVQRKSTVEYDDLFYAILLTELLFIVVLIVALYWMNRRLLRNLWKPFFSTLNKTSEYKITDGKPLELPETTIQEFGTLNAVLQQMTAKIEQDYKSLKQFTENASHEIQTPLSIITNRIELLLQSNDLEDSQWKSINEIYRAAHRLSRLNRALLLLTKIENRYFTKTESVNITDLLKLLITEYEEPIRQKKLTLQKEIADKIIISANAELIELLLRNLLTNALKHNVKNGIINVQLSDDKCIISNTGDRPLEDTSRYFERFHKNNSSDSSLGLGLAIVKEICNVNGFNCKYFYENNLHRIDIAFSNSLQNRQR